MTNGEKLLKVFPEAKENEKDFIWSVGLEVGGTTLIISRQFWESEYQEGKE